MSHELCLEMLDLTLYPAADPMLDQIDLGGTDAERLRHLQNRLFLDHVQVEHLVVPGVALPFYLLNGGVDQVLLPFIVPDVFQLESGRVLNLSERGGR